MDEQGKYTHLFFFFLSNFSVWVIYLKVIFKIDDYWLKALNEERKKEDLGELTADVFEAVIDRLEKEWFDLVSIFSNLSWCY